jgi:hypothetical protein
VLRELGYEPDAITGLEQRGVIATAVAPGQQGW